MNMGQRSIAQKLNFSQGHKLYRGHCLTKNCKIDIYASYCPKEQNLSALEYKLYTN